LKIIYTAKQKFTKAQTIVLTQKMDLLNPAILKSLRRRHLTSFKRSLASLKSRRLELLSEIPNVTA
jgi:hypothetical protein